MRSPRGAWSSEECSTRVVSVSACPLRATLTSIHMMRYGGPVGTVMNVLEGMLLNNIQTAFGHVLLEVLCH